MIVHGFTGTQDGWSAKQFDAFQDWVWEISALNPERHTLRHGDCIGADANAHEVCFEMGWHIIVHPPSDPKKRANVHLTRFWDPARCTMMDPFPYLDRNKHIVDGSIELIATPLQKEEQLRSGTWSTVRYAKKKPIPVRFFHRDGSVHLEMPTRKS